MKNEAPIMVLIRNEDLGKDVLMHQSTWEMQKGILTKCGYKAIDVRVAEKQLSVQFQEVDQPVYEEE